uniref:Kinesin motor domain-containing protein n=1 Tax=Percolomonas cosmopolitus TaxID=63605 RepID=A0A7S1PI74_9EUKA|mmetsp:Transcript_349/g.1299  ORF Transcript_349/g.1299 Transcript_349/m.1299 type:complete len:1313 (+) Transcript_349:431-4369(+)|eukprot:CAMPEP_0117448210 /NCGR_PEP_ID=MMETSP0759-20121206/7281_1 /TAXON_ID=63605 /ORGANISM="Percolomonas cosmopolitus, Strain WS" /LENGTH=1312 /DNA_ID=CAMNT_0005240585 /DNA_START=391 /DNA_END=4329 /DNA_ORIENTATION=-
MSNRVIPTSADEQPITSPRSSTTSLNSSRSTQPLIPKLAHNFVSTDDADNVTPMDEIMATNHHSAREAFGDGQTPRSVAHEITPQTHVDMITPRGSNGSRTSSRRSSQQAHSARNTNNNGASSHRSSPKSIPTDEEEEGSTGDLMRSASQKSGIGHMRKQSIHQRDGSQTPLGLHSTGGGSSTASSPRVPQQKGLNAAHQQQVHQQQLMMNSNAIEIHAQKYVPLKFAQERIKKILADWTNMKMEYIHNLQRIETQYKAAEEEDQEYMKTFVKTYAKKYKALKSRLRNKIKGKEQQIKQMNRQIRLLQGEDATQIDAEEETVFNRSAQMSDTESQADSESGDGMFPSNLFDRRTFATAEVQTAPIQFKSGGGSMRVAVDIESQKELKDTNEILNDEVSRLKTNLTEMAEYYESKIKEKDVEMKELGGQIADLESFKQKIIQLEEGSDNEEELDALITESVSRDRQRSAATRERLSSEQQIRDNQMIEEIRASASKKESHYQRKVTNLTETIESLRSQIVKLTEERDDEDEEDDNLLTSLNSARSTTQEPSAESGAKEPSALQENVDTAEQQPQDESTIAKKPEIDVPPAPLITLRGEETPIGTVDSPVPATPSTIANASDERKQKMIKTLQERLQQAKKKLKALTNQKSVLLESIENYKKDMLLKEEQLKEQQSELHGHQIQVTDLRQKLSSAEEMLATKDDTIADLERRITKTAAQFRPQTSTGMDAKKELKKLKAFQLVKEQELASAKKKLVSLQQKLESSQQEYEKLEKKHQKLTQESESTIQQLKDQQSQIMEKMKTAVEKKVERATAKKSKELEVLKKHHEAFKSKISKLVKELEKTRKEKDALQTEMTRLEELTTNSSTTIEELKAQIERDAHFKEDSIEATKKLKEFTVKYDEMATSLNVAEDKARKLYNRIEDMKGKIRVYARVRPFSSVETDSAVHTNIVDFVDDSTLTIIPKEKTFRFNRVFSPNNTQDEVFSDTKDLIQSSLDGYNVCIFAYGQTGTGKTWTITGKPGKDEGLLPKAVREAYAVAQKKSKLFDVTLEVQMVELYLDDILDLLSAEKNNFKSRMTPSGKSTKIEVKKDASGNVIITNSVIIRCENADQMLEVYRIGEKHRHSRATGMNPDSSRSHLIFTVHIQAINKKTQDVLVGKLSLVDLAGSESRKKTGLTDQTALDEAKAINMSLLHLGEVINSLSTGKRPNYRNSLLTQLLADSLGGSAKTLMFVCVGPSAYNTDTTLKSLQYAERAKKIQNDVSKKAESSKVSGLKKAVASLGDALRFAVENGGQLPGGVSLAALLDESQDFQQVS